MSLTVPPHALTDNALANQDRCRIVTTNPDRVVGEPARKRDLHTRQPITNLVADPIDQSSSVLTRSFNHESSQKSVRPTNQTIGYETDPRSTYQTIGYKADPRSTNKTIGYKTNARSTNQTIGYKTDPRSTNQTIGYKTDPRSTNQTIGYKTDPRSTNRTIGYKTLRVITEP